MYGITETTTSNKKQEHRWKFRVACQAVLDHPFTYQPSLQARSPPLASAAWFNKRLLTTVSQGFTTEYCCKPFLGWKGSSSLLWQLYSPTWRGCCTHAGSTKFLPPPGLSLEHCAHLRISSSDLPWVVSSVFDPKRWRTANSWNERGQSTRHPKTLRKTHGIPNNKKKHNKNSMRKPWMFNPGKLIHSYHSHRTAEFVGRFLLFRVACTPEPPFKECRFHQVQFTNSPKIGTGTPMLYLFIWRKCPTPELIVGIHEMWACLVISSHLKNMLVKLHHFPRDRDENKECLGCHHLEIESPKHLAKLSLMRWNTRTVSKCELTFLAIPISLNFHSYVDSFKIIFIDPFG